MRGDMSVMEQAVHAIEVDERAEVGDVFDDALRTWPGWMLSSKSRRLLIRCSSMSSRRERTMFFRS
jgi:hypothetical protein